MSAFKKLSLGIIGLLFSASAYADTISVPAFSADSSVDHLNTFRTTVVNVINGNISGAAGTGSDINILANSVSETDMFDDANPRLRDSYLLGITYDTISGGVPSSQGAFVYSGGTPATDSDLTSDVSAIIAFVNGYYITKAATSQTYANNTVTYLWLNQSGSYVQSTNPNTTVSNAALLASVTTAGGAITAVTDLAHRSLPGLLVTNNYRDGLYVSRDTTGTITIFPGSCEINDSMLSKSTVSTLTLAKATDWAGGVSLQATDTYGYVGMDSSGNLKLHTTAPTHQNYALTVTNGKKRYANWSSTVYRILGWFYMNSSGSGQLNANEVGNIKEGNVPNSTFLVSESQELNSTANYITDQSAIQRYYSSGNPVTIEYNVGAANSGASNTFATISVDNVGVIGTDRSVLSGGTTTEVRLIEVKNNRPTLSQGTHTIVGQFKRDSNIAYINQRVLTVEEQ